MQNTPPMLGELGKVSLQLYSGENEGKIWIDEMVINDDDSKGGFKTGTNLVHSIVVSKETIPHSVLLNQNFPNPFNPKTLISWEMDAPNKVILAVYNMQGQLIENLVNGEKNAGYHSMDWNAESNPSGIYFYTLTIGNETFKKKMILLK
jgi:hypothetical protein